MHLGPPTTSTKLETSKQLGAQPVNCSVHDPTWRHVSTQTPRGLSAKHEGKLTTATATQFELAQPPNDAISSLVFAPSSPTRLLVSSWDKNVYLYDTHSDGAEGHGTLHQTFEHRAPVLDVCFGADDDEAFSAGMDWTVRRIDLKSGDLTLVSKHTAPVRRVVYSREHCSCSVFASGRPLANVNSSQLSW